MTHALHPTGGVHFANFDWHGITYHLWVASNGRMFAEVGKRRVESSTLEDLKTAIKKVVVNRRLRIKVEVWELRNNGEFEHGIIHSVSTDGDYLCKWDDGETDKLHSYSSAYNATKLTDLERAELVTKTSEASALNRRINELRKKAAMDLGKPVRLALEEARAKQEAKEVEAEATIVRQAD
jgi:uncharacterized protein YodC (DUF2158 family)